MSRSSNRGPRADIALLRKLKADPNFSPSSLLNAGPNFLDKANKLKGFVSEQRGKLGASAAKTEWLLAYQHLQGDQDDAERELTTCLQLLADFPGTELREVAEASSTLYSQAEACRAERMRLRSQVKSLSSVHCSFKAYGAPSQFTKEARALKGEMSATAKEMEDALAQLTERVVALTADLRDSWPSALAGAGAAAEGLAAAMMGGGAADVSISLPGNSRTEDCEELERMMARYPLASSDIKERIREVFAALQEKYFERLETWRMEADHAAMELSARPAGPSASLAFLPRRTHQAGTAPQPQPAARTQPSGPAAAPGAGRTAAGRCGRGAAGAAPSAAGPSAGSPGQPAAAGRGALRVHQPPPAVAVGPKRGSFTGAAEGGGDGPLSPGGRPASFMGPGGVWGFGGCGGWSPEEHSAFVRHRDRLFKEGGQGPKSSGREAIMARIATLLPGGRTTADVMAHDDWTTAARMLGRKRKDLAEGWDRERRQFLEDSSSFLQESETTFLVQAEEAADRLVAELLRERARDELQELRAERAHDEEVAAAERGALEAAEAEARILSEARERQDRAVKKDMIAAYRAELERQQAEIDAAAAEAEREAALVAETQAVYNRERVEVRHTEYLERQEQVKERQEAAEAEVEAREARLERLRALVAPHVEADPERLLAPTLASAATMDKSEGAFHPVNGYTTDQVVKDQRFKVMEALSAVGLQQTTYGRKAIAAARPAQATRPDNFTSEQREAMMKR